MRVPSPAGPSVAAAAPNAAAPNAAAVRARARPTDADARQQLQQRAQCRQLCVPQAALPARRCVQPELSQDATATAERREQLRKRRAETVMGRWHSQCL